MLLSDSTGRKGIPALGPSRFASRTLPAISRKKMIAAMKKVPTLVTRIVLYTLLNSRLENQSHSVQTPLSTLKMMIRPIQTSGRINHLARLTILGVMLS